MVLSILLHHNLYSALFAHEPEVAVTPLDRVVTRPLLPHPLQEAMPLETLLERRALKVRRRMWAV